MKFKQNDFLLWGCLLAFTGIAVAEDWDFGGHIKYQTQYEPQSSLNNFLDFRLNTENRWGAWDAKIHYEVLADYSENLDVEQRLDRFFLGYNGEQLVLRLGRQAVSWGNGMIFHPLDIFSPFSPTEIDKDYKTGDDMVYGQWLFDNGDDLQMILLPRRNLDTNEVESDQSSLAFKYHGRYQEQWDFDLLAARHFNENVFGFGLSKDILEALWRFDVSATRLKKGGTAISLITNMDYSWVWFKRNFYGFVEYFHNGVGERLSSDYLGSGVKIELTPLFNIDTNWIGNLHHNSGIFQIRGIYDWMENLQLIGWLDQPYGDKGTEFDGNFTPERTIYFRLIYYF